MIVLVIIKYDPSLSNMSSASEQSKKKSSPKKDVMKTKGPVVETKKVAKPKNDSSPKIKDDRSPTSASSSSPIDNERRAKRKHPRMLPLKVVMTDGEFFITYSSYANSKKAKVESDGMAVLYLDTDHKTHSAWQKERAIIRKAGGRVSRFDQNLSGADNLLVENTKAESSNI